MTSKALQALLFALLLGIGAADARQAVMQSDSRWRTTIIPVCWENPKPEDEHLRQLTRQAVAETWEQVSLLSFTGWGECLAGERGVHIAVRDEAPHTVGVGRFLDGRSGGMVLNFTFRDWGPSCQEQPDFCAYVESAHEFGHAIGLTHEQNRFDAPPRCRREAQGPDGDYNITKYDPLSIMNYCNPKWAGDGKLSPLDIKAVQMIYGARPQPDPPQPEPSRTQ